MSQPLDLPEEKSTVPANCAELCDMCTNIVRSMSRGVLCGLTDDKPRFERLCPHFAFGMNALRELEDKKLQLKSKPYRQGAAARTLVINLVYGQLAIAGGIVVLLFLPLIFTVWVAATMIAAGFGFVARGAYQFMRMNRQRNQLRSKVERMEVIVEAYHHSLM